MAGLGEFAFIERLLRPLAAGYPGALDLTDDAALVDVPDGCQLVIAKDAMVEGVHYLADDPPDLIAGKLLRVNVSDLAAMGADPLGYLTALARPKTLDDAWLTGFAQGLGRDQAEFGLHLLGGDTVSTPGPTMVTLTILGTVPRGQALRRQGAAAGDDVWVTGTLGDAALGLRVLRGLAVPEDHALVLADRYRTPRPRLKLGIALRGVATAAIDVSDGLVADLGHILDCSGVGAEVEAASLPLSPEARSIPGALEAALTGGDDYEVLFTAPQDRRELVVRIGRDTGTAVTRIGRIVTSGPLRVLDGQGRPLSLSARGWQHF